MDVDPAIRARATLLRLIEHIRPSFPLHAGLISGELIGNRLTNDRWYRIHSALASMHSIPGVGLGPDEHTRRNTALFAKLICHYMGQVTWGLNPERAMGWVDHVCDEVDRRIDAATFTEDEREH